MATKSYEFDLWAARDDDDNSLWTYLSKPKKEKRRYYNDITVNDKLISCIQDNITPFQEELNLTNINEPYKFKAKLIFEGLPDNPDNPESDSINNQKQEIMPENSQTPLEQAKAAVHFHSNCKLLTKEEYEELCKYKGLYLDLKGSIEQISNTFKDK